jgi:hypothetical protein
MMNEVSNLVDFEDYLSLHIPVLPLWFIGEFIILILQTVDLRLFNCIGPSRKSI